MGSNYFLVSPLPEDYTSIITTSFCLGVKQAKCTSLELSGYHIRMYFREKRNDLSLRKSPRPGYEHKSGRLCRVSIGSLATLLLESSKAKRSATSLNL